MGFGEEEQDGQPPLKGEACPAPPAVTRTGGTVRASPGCPGGVTKPETVVEMAVLFYFAPFDEADCQHVIIEDAPPRAAHSQRISQLRSSLPIGVVTINADGLNLVLLQFFQFFASFLSLTRGRTRRLLLRTNRSGRIDGDLPPSTMHILSTTFVDIDSPQSRMTSRATC